MKLSDRDLKLLVILLIVAVIVCPIFFVLRPFSNKISDIEANITTLTERQSFLAKLNENRTFYLNSIELLAGERDKIVSNYSKGLSDEDTVMFLANTEKKIPIAMKTLSFATSEPTEISQSYVNELGETVEGLTAYTQYATVEYVAKYEDFKTFLGYILDSDDKMVLTTVSANQDDEDGTITGVFVLNKYAVTGEGREFVPATIPSMDHGTDNVFGVPAGLAEEQPAAAEE